MAGGDAQAIVDVALASAKPELLDPASRYAVVVPDDGSVNIIEPTPDRDLAHPRRPSGTSVVLDVAGLKWLWDKHADATSELFADVDAARVVAVLNGDGGSGKDAGHRDHRAVLQLTKTPEWNAWVGLSGKLIPQVAFAEFLEDHVGDIYSTDGSISGVEMLELAQTFEQKTKVSFKSSDLLHSGERRLVYEEEGTAKAGEKGQITIPTSFTIAVSPYEGMDRYRVKVRFRYRIQDGQLTLGYKLDRPEDVLRQAFTDVTALVAEATDREVLRGLAPAERR